MSYFLWIDWNKKSEDMHSFQVIIHVVRRLTVINAASEQYFKPGVTVFSPGTLYKRYMALNYVTRQTHNSCSKY